MIRTVTPGWPPTFLTAATREERARGSGGSAVKFINQFCRVTKDSMGGRAGEQIRLRRWQQNTMHHLLARKLNGRNRFRQGLIGVPRKNGKSSLLSGLDLYALVLGPEGGEVYCVATTKDQARIVFDATKRMIALDPDLSSVLVPYKDAIEYRKTGSVFRVLAAEAPQLEGLNPTFITYDEVHAAPNRELWDVLALAMDARTEPMLIGITTAGARTDSSGQDSLCYQMYDQGRRIVAGEEHDPSTFFAWWEPRNPDADHRDPATWREANPGFDDLIDPDGMEIACLKTPEAQFKTKRLNMWVTSWETWLTAGVWEDCGTGAAPKPGATVVLAVDGSYSNDSTAIICADYSTDPTTISVAGLWDRPITAHDDWKVPIVEVEATIEHLCQEYAVAEIACDPFRWSRTMDVLSDKGLPIVEYPQSAARMIAATQRFQAAAYARNIQHVGDPALARHIRNATLKTDVRGARLTKETGGRKIDAAVTAIMAYDRAEFHRFNGTKQRTVYAFR
jgi:phage terminase large subunit-like protein